VARHERTVRSHQRPCLDHHGRWCGGAGEYDLGEFEFARGSGREDLSS